MLLLYKEGSDILEQTSNYHLNKPVISEKIDINLLNQNMDIIDRELNNETNSFGSVSGNLNSHIENKTNPHNVTKKQLELENVENKSSSTIRGEITKDNVTNALGYTPYTPNEIDNKFSALETKIDWKEAVDTYEDIASTYPSPEDGWTVNVKDTDYTYRYNGEKWVAISANAVPKATNEIDGILSKEDYSRFNDANAKKHTHNNMSILTNITTTSVSSWNKAVEHISDNEMHISSNERSLWNTVDSKVDKEEGKGLSSNDFTDKDKKKLNDIPSDAEKNVQADWNVEDETSDAYIKNKPQISDIINPDDFVKKTGDTMTGALTVNANVSVNTLNGLPVSNASTFSRIPIIDNVGLSEIGRYLDFHYESCETDDWSARLEVTGKGANQLKMNGIFQTTSNLIVGNDIQLNGMEYVGKIGWHESGTRDDGWDVIADIKITSSYTDSPLVFEVVHRHGQTPMEISVLFAATNNADPSLQSFTYQGSNYDARIWKTAASTWRLAVKRSESADEQIITRFIKQTTGGAQITWTKALITSLPASGVTQAVLGGQVATEINLLKNSVKTVVYQSAEPTSGLVNNLVWVG